MTLYTLSGLIKRYGSRCVVDIPRLELQEGKIYALLGPNGAGKTTLLNMLAFLDAPSAGRLLFRGKPVRFSESELQLLRRQVVMVDQNPILFSTTVRKNIDFGLKIRGIDKHQRDRTIDEALELVGMRKFETAEAHKLSGGETQRVALARALALSPKVFLCDEPTANVDSENQAVIIDLLERINADKKISVIFTTHDRSQATTLTDRTLVLDDGCLVRTGYENLFTATVTRGDADATLLSVGPHLILPLPPAQHIRDAAAMVKIAIDPAAITIAAKERSEFADGSGPWKIVQVTRDNGGIRIVADAGVRVTVRLTCEEYKRLKLMVGDQIKLEIPPSAVQLF